MKLDHRISKEIMVGIIEDSSSKGLGTVKPMLAKYMYTLYNL